MEGQEDGRGVRESGGKAVAAADEMSCVCLFWTTQPSLAVAVCVLVTCE